MIRQSCVMCLFRLAFRGIVCGGAACEARRDRSRTFPLESGNYSSVDGWKEGERGGLRR